MCSVTNAPKRGDIARSDELQAVALRFWNAFIRGDAPAAIGRLSMADGVTFLGTAENEFLDDGEQIRALIKLNFELLGEWPMGQPQIDARLEGPVGWTTVRGSIATPQGEQEMRATLIFHLEHDEWRIIHQHYSISVPNPDTFGIDVPIEKIADLVQAERPDLGSQAAADGTITVVFTDIVGSTELTNAFGDRAWREVLRAHNRIIEDATRAEGGTGVKGQGDGFMLTFSSARRALAASAVIQRRIGDAFNDPGTPIQVRIGMHTGELLREGDDFFGGALNYAARVASSAGGNEIVVSSLVHDLVSSTGEFAFSQPREVELKGFTGKHRVYPLVAN